jgi:arylsulfatase
MKRKERFLALFSAIVLILVALAFLSTQKMQPASKPKQDDRPNIIYIMADDMGYSDLGCYGSEVATPNLDLLAEQGVKFRTFYNNARCCPTRATLLTGQYPHVAGMGDMVSMPQSAIIPGSYQGFIDPSYPTVAESLKKAGYDTYMTGKWHVGERKEHWPLKRGFDHYFGLISGASSFYEIIPQEKGKRHMVKDNDHFDIPENGFYMTDAFTDHAIVYLNEQKKNDPLNPFFLYVAYTAPHFPIHALEPDVKKYESLYTQGWDVTREKRYAKMKKLGLVDKRYQLTARPPDIPAWEAATDKNTWVRKMAVYAAMIDRMDQNIGKLIHTLKANDQYRNTIIVFLSDNGASPENVSGRNFNDPNIRIGEKGSYVTYDVPWANVSNTPFRKYKKYVHEGGIITPCIVHWPARLKPRKGFIDEAGHVMDLMPTALELAGVPAKGLPGSSLSYLWASGKPTERTIFWEHEGNKAMRKGHWKLVKDLEDASWALYDLAADPCEVNNLATVKPQMLQDMFTAQQRWEKEVGVKPVRRGSSNE